MVRKAQATRAPARPVAKVDTVGADPRKSVYGEAVTFETKVRAGRRAADMPTGLVTFLDGGTPLGTGELDDAGTAVFTTTSPLSVGNHPITASYSGDDRFESSESTAPRRPTVAVAKAATTTARVAASPNAPVYGQAVTFTTTVSAVAPGAGVPTGSVCFHDGDNLLGTANLDPTGTASCSPTTLLSGGPHSITASYDGDDHFKASKTTSPLNLTVGKVETNTSLSSAINPAVVGSSVTLTASVTLKSPRVAGMVDPTGTVSFYDNSANLGGPSIGGQIARLSTQLQVGAHAITATYSGDNCFAGSTSPPFTQTIVTEAQEILLDAKQLFASEQQTFRESLIDPLKDVLDKFPPLPDDPTEEEVTSFQQIRYPIKTENPSAGTDPLQIARFLKFRLEDVHKQAELTEQWLELHGPELTEQNADSFLQEAKMRTTSQSVGLGEDLKSLYDLAKALCCAPPAPGPSVDLESICKLLEKLLV